MVHGSFNKNEIQKEKKNIWVRFQYCSTSIAEREAGKSLVKMLCLFYTILGLFLQFIFLLLKHTSVTVQVCCVYFQTTT